MDAEIKIKEETFRLDFSLMAFLLLGKKWNLKTIKEVIAEIAELDKGNEDLAFDDLEKFGEIIQCLANSAEGNPREIKDQEILRLPLPEIMSMFKNFSTMMVDSIKNETTDEQGKSKAAKNKAAKNQ